MTAGGYRISKTLKADIEEISNLLNKAITSIDADINLNRVQKYLMHAKSICNKYTEVGNGNIK